MSLGTYKLKDAKKLLRAGRVLIESYTAGQMAWNDFGWREDDIKAAFLKLNGDLTLNGGHFHKTADSDSVPGRKLDFYKAENLNGERVYFHFYIEDEMLVIDSCKRIRENQ